MTNNEVLEMINDKIKTYKLVRENELFYTYRINDFLRIYNLFAPNLAIFPSYFGIIIFNDFYFHIRNKHPYTSELNKLYSIRKRLKNGEYNPYISTTKEEYESEESKRLERNYKDYNDSLENDKVLKIIRKM